MTEPTEAALDAVLAGLEAAGWCVAQTSFTAATYTDGTVWSALPTPRAALRAALAGWASPKAVAEKEQYVEAASTSQGKPEPRRWRHRKRGTVYTEVGRAEVQAGHSIVEGDHLVVYRGDDGRLWARPVSEFEDGRFEAASPSQGKAGADG